MSHPAPFEPAIHAQAATLVRTAGRLHLGFLDPSASLGRRFGSIGLMIDGFDTEIQLGAAPADAQADHLRANGAAASAMLPRVADCLQRLREHSGIGDALALQLQQVPPAHAGFGSGTQLALAVGRAFADWHGLGVSTAELAGWLGRGRRSAIGIAGFDRGGLLVDGGPAFDGTPGKLLAGLDFPTDWRIVVVLDERQQGLSGARESQAIATLPALPQAAAADICHQVLMRVLPGAADGDFSAFATGLNRVQHHLGHHFAPAQGGQVWTSSAVGRLMQWLGHAWGDRVALGQSSWGPTGFAIVPTAVAAQQLILAARAAGAVDPALELRTVAARRHGATVRHSASR